MLNKHFTSLEHLLDQINSFQTHPEPTGQALFFEEPFEVYGLVIPQISYQLPTNVFLVSYAVAQMLDAQTICYWAYGNPLKKDSDHLSEIPEKNIIRIVFHKGNPAAIAFHHLHTDDQTPFFSHIFPKTELKRIPDDFVSVYLSSIEQQFKVNPEYKDLFKERLISINSDLPSFI